MGLALLAWKLITRLALRQTLVPATALWLFVAVTVSRHYQVQG
jgi:hypothetical protein